MLAVALLYRVVARRFGALAGLAGGAGAGGVPVVRRRLARQRRRPAADPADAARLRRRRCARARPGAGARCCWSGVLVGLAFNTKTLAAYLVVPGIALGYLRLRARDRSRRRLAQLLAAGVVMVVVSFAWIAVVEATPASKRPYVGSSTNNTELGLTFNYNGFGRVGGQTGGPGQIPVGTGGVARKRRRAARAQDAPKRPRDARRARTARQRPRDPAQRPRAQPDPVRRPARAAAAVRRRASATRAAGCCRSRSSGCSRSRCCARCALGCEAREPRRPRAGDAARGGATRAWRADRARRLVRWSRRPCSACRRGSSTPTTSRRSDPGVAAMVGAGACAFAELARRARLALAAARRCARRRDGRRAARAAAPRPLHALVHAPLLIAERRRPAGRGARRCWSRRAAAPAAIGAAARRCC